MFGKFIFQNFFNIIRLKGFFIFLKRNWKSGEKIANIDLDSTLMQPEYIKFSPVNWRSLAVAYSSEIKFYTFEPFDKENVKIKPSRVAMSPINSEKEPKILPDFSVNISLL